MTNNKQTAVEYLIEQLFPKVLSEEQYYHINKAKEMEKEQIIRAFVVAEGAEYEGIKYGVHYYIKTYGGSNEQQ